MKSIPIDECYYNNTDPTFQMKHTKCMNGKNVYA